MIVGIGGILVSGVVGALTRNNAFIDADAGFVPLMLAGGAAFWISDRPAQYFAQQQFEAAFALARQAKHAARAGDCAQVQAIEPQIAALDESVLRRFHHEPVIAACFPPPAGSAR